MNLMAVPLKSTKSVNQSTVVIVEAIDEPAK